MTGGMLLVGYRSVVATMWSIKDDIAPEVADEFCRRIPEDGGRPDNRKAAEALHYSIQKLRKKGAIPLTLWIPFVHLGVKHLDYGNMYPLIVRVGFLGQITYRTGNPKDLRQFIRIKWTLFTLSNCIRKLLFDLTSWNLKGAVT
jgi:hypothetical protein